MPPILVLSSAKRIAKKLLVTAKLNERKEFKGALTDMKYFVRSKFFRS